MSTWLTKAVEALIWSLAVILDSILIPFLVQLMSIFHSLCVSVSFLSVCLSLSLSLSLSMCVLSLKQSTV